MNKLLVNGYPNPSDLSGKQAPSLNAAEETLSDKPWTVREPGARLGNDREAAHG